jgi:hypothetical protein
VVVVVVVLEVEVVLRVRKHAPQHKSFGRRRFGLVCAQWLLGRVETIAQPKKRLTTAATAGFVDQVVRTVAVMQRQCNDTRGLYVEKESKASWLGKETTEEEKAKERPSGEMGY